MTNLLKTGLLRSRRNTTIGSGIRFTSDGPKQTAKYIGDVAHPTTGEKISMYIRPIRTLGRRGFQKDKVQAPEEYRKSTGVEKDRQVSKVLKRVQKVRPEEVSDKQVPSNAEPVMASSTHQSVPPTKIELGKSTDLTPHLQSTPLDAALSANYIVQSRTHKSHLPPGVIEHNLKINGKTITFIDRPATPAEERAHTRKILVRVGGTQKEARNALKANPHKDQFVVELKERIPTPPPEDSDNFAFGFVTGFTSLICIMVIFG
jgi:hypothetical protein